MDSPQAVELKRIETAIEEAERFVKRARVMADALRAGLESWRQSPERAAMRRASMDLTRVLPPLRRPQ
jgi:hypothetical protein